jgi:hypothetical protein
MPLVLREPEAPFALEQFVGFIPEKQAAGERQIAAAGRIAVADPS